MKKNKGITLIALVITIVILIILVGVTITSITGEEGVQELAESAQNQYLISADEETNKINNLSDKIDDVTKKQELLALLNEKTYVDEITGPDLSGFNPTNTYLAVYNSDATDFVSFSQLSKVKSDLTSFVENNTWYDYENNKWANIKIITNDLETWWTWIPRYAYKNEETTTTVIFIDKDNKTKDGEDYLELGYTLAPVFKSSDGKRGIWVSKYEPCKNGELIEIKDTINVYNSITISDCYSKTKEMKNANTGGLDETNVDVHMANNREWATVSYLSNSNYGTSGVGENTGISITTVVTTHYSTNGNITGVMDWGKNYTFTAGVVSGYVYITDDTLRSNGLALLNDASTKEQIDKINSLSATDMAINGWYSSFKYYSGNASHNPFVVRKGVFGFIGGTRRWWRPLS